MNYLNQWVFFALLAPFLWAFGNIFDKVIISKYIKGINEYLIFIGLLYLTYIIYLPLVDINGIRAEIIILQLIAGMCHFLGVYFYLNALKIEEASIVIPLGQIGPVFVLILSILFLREKLLQKQILAFLFILAGSFIISIKEDIKHIFKISRAFILMILCALVMAFNGILMKYTLDITSLWTGMFLNGVGHLIPLLFFLIKFKINNLFIQLKKMNRTGWLMIILTSIVYTIANASVTYATQLGPVSMVSVLGGSQSVFVFIFTIIISSFFPNMFKEELSLFAVAKKSIAIVIILIGLGLLYL